MSLLGKITMGSNGNTTTINVYSEVAQIILAVMLMAVYLVELVEKLGQDQFIGGALVAVIGYYFGGKNANTSASTASTSTLNAATSSNTSPTTN